MEFPFKSIIEKQDWIEKEKWNRDQSEYPSADGGVGGLPFIVELHLVLTQGKLAETGSTFLEDFFKFHFIIIN